MDSYQDSEKGTRKDPKHAASCLQVLQSTQQLRAVMLGRVLPADLRIQGQPKSLSSRRDTEASAASTTR